MLHDVTRRSRDDGNDVDDLAEICTLRPIRLALTIITGHVYRFFGALAPEEMGLPLSRNPIRSDFFCIGTRARLPETRVVVSLVSGAHFHGKPEAYQQNAEPAAN